MSRAPPNRLLLVLLAAATACKQETGSKNAAETSEPTPLYVYIWTNYHSPAAIARFEKAHHARVVIDTYDTNEVIEQKLQSGVAPYDVVVPSDYMVRTLAKKGLLLPLDASKLPGLAGLDPALDFGRGAPRFAVPYMWGTTGFAYRTDKIPDALDSWAALYDPRWKRKIVLLDDMREVYVTALKLGGHSLNATTAVALEDARRRLTAQRPLVLAYDSTDFAGKLRAGDAWIAHGYSGELARVSRDSGGKIRYVVPKEGATLAVDGLAIPRAAKHVDLAYAFLAFNLDPAVAAEVSNHTGYPTANAAARAQVKPELLADPAVYPGRDVLSRCEPFADLGETLTTLDTAWTELKAQ